MNKRKSKEVTRERAATMLERAIEGSRHLGLDDVADRYAAMSVDDYAEEKGLVFINPSPTSTATNKAKKRSNNIMSETLTDPRTKAEIVEENEEYSDHFDTIWNDFILAEDRGEMDAKDALESIAELLNDFDAERFPYNDDEAEEDEAD